MTLFCFANLELTKELGKLKTVLAHLDASHAICHTRHKRLFSTLPLSPLCLVTSDNRATAPMSKNIANLQETSPAPIINLRDRSTIL